MRTTRVLVAGLLALAIVGPAAAADGRKVIRARLLYVNPTDGDSTILIKGFGNAVRVEMDTSWGGEIGYEHMLGEKLGLSFTLGWSSHDLGYRVASPSRSGQIGDLSMTPFTGTALYHFNPDSRTDVYLGAGISYVAYDADSDAGDSISVGDDLALAVEFGVDFPLAPRGLFLSFNLKYINTTADFEGESLGTDPFLLGAGVAFRF